MADLAPIEVTVQLSPELKQELDHLHGRFDALEQQLRKCPGQCEGCTVTHQVELVAKGADLAATIQLNNSRKARISQ